MVGLLDSDEEDDYLRDAGLDDRSDDELGFQEKEVDNGLDSEGEEEQETELQSNTNRLILYSATTSLYRTINESIDSLIPLVPGNVSLAACLLVSYPGRVGGERWPGIDCLRMCGRFCYTSVEL